MERLHAQIFQTDKDRLWLTELNLLTREEKIRPQYDTKFKGVKKVIIPFLRASNLKLAKRFFYPQAALPSFHNNIFYRCLFF